MKNHTHKSYATWEKLFGHHFLTSLANQNCAQGLNQTFWMNFID